MTISAFRIGLKAGYFPLGHNPTAMPCPATHPLP